MTHRLWVINDPVAIEALREDFAGRKLYIADGHHRYETGLRYRDTLARQGAYLPGSQYILMTLTDMADPGLTVFPTHRLVRGLERQGRHAFALYDGKSWTVLALKDTAVMEKLLPEKSQAYRTLDVSILHSLVLEKLLGIDKENMANQKNLTYTRSAEEAQAAVDRGESQCCFLLNPTRVEEIGQVAANGEKMPQKSTYFYPKLITGLAMNDLETPAGL